MYKKEKPLTTVDEPDMSGTYTAADYLQWKIEEMVELIRGKIFKMTPAPSSDHQRVSVELIRIFANHFHQRKCEVFEAPFDVYLVKKGEDYRSAENIVEPDVCVICEPGKIKKFGCVGAPDLVVEIISPSTAQKDQKDKFELYEEYGVREYWLVYPATKSVIAYHLEGGKYVSSRPITETEKMRHFIFPKLEVDLKEVFRHVTEG